MLITANSSLTKVNIRDLLSGLPDVSEVFWFLVTLFLFMILGPFAAPFALFAILNLDSEYRGKATPELKE